MLKNGLSFLRIWEVVLFIDETALSKGGFYFVITNKKAKDKKGEIFHPEIFDNGDTRKQLFARDRYLFYKAENNWMEWQVLRVKILFR